MSDSTSRVRIEIDSKGDFGAFDTGADKVDQLSQSIKTAQGALGALGFGISAAAVIGFTEKIISGAAEISNLSARIGISVEAFQVLNNVARQTGLGAAQLEAILAKLKDSIELAADRGGKAEKALEKLGLSAKVLANVPLERVLEAVAVAVDKAKNKTEAYAAASDILGIRYLPKLAETLHRVAGGYDEIEKNQRENGMLTEEVNIKRLTLVWEHFGNAIAIVKAKMGNGLGYMVGMMEGQEAGPKWLKEYFDGLINSQGSPWAIPAGAEPTQRARGKPLAKNSPFLPNPEKNQGTTYVSDDTSAKGIIALSGQYNRDNAETKANLDLQKQITEAVKAQSGEYEKHIAQNLALIAKAEDLADPLKADRDEIEAMAKAYKEAGISTEGLEKAIAKIRDHMNDTALKEFFGTMDKEKTRRPKLPDFQQSQKNFSDSQSSDTEVNPHAMTPSQGAQAALMDYATRIGSVGNQIKATFGSIASSLSGGIANGITGLIMKTQTWAGALRNIGTTVLATVIQAIVDMGIRWVITHTMMAAASRALALGSLAANIPIAMAQSAIWAVPATLSTIASFGGAAAAAPLEIGAAAALVAGLSLASDGGYFPGDPSKARGIFHGDEYVFSAPAVRNIGADNLEQMHRNGVMNSAPSKSIAADSSGSESSSPIHLHMHQDPVSAIRGAARTREGRQIIADLSSGVVREYRS